MKKLFAMLLLSGAAVSANAALFITNNTSCIIALEAYAHDANLPASCSYYTWFKINPNTSDAYNNVNSLNGGTGWRYTSVGPSGYATMTTAGSGWDAATFHTSITGPTAPLVGNTGTCATGTYSSLNQPGTSCPTLQMTWMNLGGNNVLLTIDP
ncbi:hypothetical protein [Taibaiella chishuiensis]|uniref:Uncharacterized protein n=1 Tax=Taibaiella chishuiensis TaxID=1434707 RepID=A0A2P8D7R6_9BACT|nr:hypothetical protein [Taibaiella chishuiensis]PSK93247.1 hypothetical protein B0I18_102217 [Taibaiella chishuiensis]